MCWLVSHLPAGWDWQCFFLQTIPKVPDQIKQKAGFTIFAPSKLPGKFVVAENSFSFQEETVVFQANDGAGHTIVFTEQKKPASFNFDDFYKTQMKDSKTFDAQYAAVAGKTQNEEVQLLSIVTDSTWILVSSRSPLDDEGLKTLAKSLVAVK